MYTKLDDKWIKVCQSLPESGMGYQYADLNMLSGSPIRVIIYNCQIIAHKEIVDISKIESISIAK